MGSIAPDWYTSLCCCLDLVLILILKCFPFHLSSVSQWRDQGAQCSTPFFCSLWSSLFKKSTEGSWPRQNGSRSSGASPALSCSSSPLRWALFSYSYLALQRLPWPWILSKSIRSLCFMSFAILCCDEFQFTYPGHGQVCPWYFTFHVCGDSLISSCLGNFVTVHHISLCSGTIRFLTVCNDLTLVFVVCLFSS